MNLLENIDTSWKKQLCSEFDKPYFLSLMHFIEAEIREQTIYPKSADVFNAFTMTPFDKLKVVILGQDPYHGENQAHGLAFSVQDGTAFPPSLKNIFKEYSSDLSYAMPKSGNLSKWADKGVFLLNAVLTVRAHVAHSHKNRGWEIFTDEVIRTISAHKKHVVFILWGKPAQAKLKLIDTSKHLILEAVHPSPLSSYRGFFGSSPFSKTNAYLETNGVKEIDWKL
ncbi:MAG: uracil-DNA glycosylase [Campylobacterales bacterium]|nr:uracil-DNA glycosylase [Campylobacterales bacterium]